MARTGRPTKRAAALKAGRRPGTKRFSLEMDATTLREVDAEARRNDRARNAEIRILVGEALAARKASRP